MARAAVPGRLAERVRWRVATLLERRAETSAASSLVFDVPGWPGHLAGQHVDVRLTAEDGYSTQRSYSIASAPQTQPQSQPQAQPRSSDEGDRIELTIQQVEDGEVSPYLVQELAVGEQIELRGPVGGWFVWRPEQTEPVLLLAGGSGIVPLMAMIRSRRAVGSRVPFRLLYSVRTPEDRMYLRELRRGDPGLDTTYLYTRKAPDGWDRQPGRLTAKDVAAFGWPPDFAPTVYVCGPTGFVEHAADLLVDLGHYPDMIRTERFGPSGS
jgi:ferredoxin-NADP reductase